ncbi:MAG: pyridoxamine 5'-phosphate oxidase family protein [Desulfobacterales bacterium]|uniref:Pyridoxamine 5'-phosphate oxidase family protein n=1 Tax=Candidatus Desulfatibia vada TaxID=2841696 RepID=A0A8J6TP71_9BACT|nr:pyridoxamine 5'-phosphate oxidase family protein [Candidatus Desulfatibia vada]
MRRKEKEILDREEMESIISKADVCRLGLSVDNIPYIVPLNFGYRDSCLYFHTPKVGKKMDMIKTNSRVCFEMDIDHEVVRAENPCDSSMKFRSVIGYGRASLLDEIEEKRRALDIIVEHYSGQVNEYKEKMVDHLSVIKVQVESMTGKKSGY